MFWHDRACKKESREKDLNAASVGRSKPRDRRSLPDFRTSGRRCPYFFDADWKGNDARLSVPETVAFRSTTDVARHAAKQGAQEVVLRETLAEVLAEPFRPAKSRETAGALSHLPHDACIIRNILLGAQPRLLAFVAGQPTFRSGQPHRDIDERA